MREYSNPSVFAAVILTRRDRRRARPASMSNKSSTGSPTGASGIGERAGASKPRRQSSRLPVETSRALARDQNIRRARDGSRLLRVCSRSLRRSTVSCHATASDLAARRCARRHDSRGCARVLTCAVVAYSIAPRARCMHNRSTSTAHTCTSSMIQTVSVWCSLLRTGYIDYWVLQMWYISVL